MCKISLLQYYNTSTLNWPVLLLPLKLRSYGNLTAG